MKQFESIDDVYVYYADKIRNAQTAVPRGLLIKELIGEGFEIKDPRKRILGNTGRKMSLSFAVGEFLWYLRGSNSVKIMQYYSKIYPNFSDDGITAHGAYGPRIFGDKQNSMNSWQAIIELLSRDPDSRQAIIPIYRAEDVGLQSRDIPCTCVLQFLLRSNKLNCITYMRSNDLYLGLPYDVFSFTMFQELMSLALGVDLGFYKHIVKKAKKRGISPFCYCVGHGMCFRVAFLKQIGLVPEPNEDVPIGIKVALLGESIEPMVTKDYCNVTNSVKMLFFQAGNWIKAPFVCMKTLFSFQHYSVISAAEKTFLFFSIVFDFLSWISHLLLAVLALLSLFSSLITLYFFLVWLVVKIVPPELQIFAFRKKYADVQITYKEVLLAPCRDLFRGLAVFALILHAVGVSYNEMGRDDD